MQMSKMCILRHEKRRVIIFTIQKTKEIARRLFRGANPMEGESAHACGDQGGGPAQAQACGAVLATVFADTAAVGVFVFVQLYANLRCSGSV